MPRRLEPEDDSHDRAVEDRGIDWPLYADASRPRKKKRTPDKDTATDWTSSFWTRRIWRSMS